MQNFENQLFYKCFDQNEIICDFFCLKNRKNINTITCTIQLAFEKLRLKKNILTTINGITENHKE